MKRDDKPRAGVFSRLLSFLFRNWGLKLLALILAIIVYHSLKTQSHASSADPHDRPLFHYR